MSGQPDTIRQSDLLHRLVLDRTTTEELGRVEVIWMHPPIHRVLGFICKSSLLGGKRFAFNLNQLQRLGANSIIVSSQPVETNATEIGHLESLIGLELWTEAGTQLGRITDCLFNLRNGVIVAYLFRSDGWRGVTQGVYQLSASQIVSFGKKRVLVSESAMHACQLYEAGVEQKLSQVGKRVQSSYLETAQELQDSFTDWRSSLSEQAKAVKQQAQQRFGHLREDAGRQVRSLQVQATQAAKTLGQQLQQETQTWTQTLSQPERAWDDPPEDSPIDHSLEVEAAEDDIWPWPEDEISPPSRTENWYQDLQDDVVVSPQPEFATQHPMEPPSPLASGAGSPCDPQQLIPEPSAAEADLWQDPASAIDGEQDETLGLKDHPAQDVEEDDPWI